MVDGSHTTSEERSENQKTFHLERVSESESDGEMRTREEFD